MSYGELALYTKRLANYLKTKGVLPGQVVGLYGHRSPAVVVAIMAILQTGAAYCMMVYSLLSPSEPLNYLIRIRLIQLSALFSVCKLRSPQLG